MVHPSQKSRPEREIDEAIRARDSGGVSIANVQQPSFGARLPNPVMWGKRGVENPPWKVNDSRVILTAEELVGASKWRVPKVQNMVLALEPVGVETSQGCFLRWILEFGAGGANTRIEFDAGGLQQVSLSAEMMRLQLVARPLAPTDAQWPAPFASPDRAYNFAVFFADGMTSTSPPNYTERFQVQAGNVMNLRPPVGATAFRICGQPTPTANSPFTAGVTYQLLPLSAAVPIDEYDGSYLEGVRLATVPFPGAAQQIQVQNPGATDVQAVIQWEIDL